MFTLVRTHASRSTETHFSERLKNKLAVVPVARRRTIATYSQKRCPFCRSRRKVRDFRRAPQWGQKKLFGGILSWQCLQVMNKILAEAIS